MGILIIIAIMIISLCIYLAKRRVITIREYDAKYQKKLNKYQTNPVDVLINSSYYHQYKRVFDYIKDHDENQHQYKIDWLLWSLNKGRKLEEDGIYVIKSIDGNLPYFCETEIEYMQFEDKNSPVLKGHIEGMMNLAAFYNVEEKGGCYHPYKAKYWKKRLKKIARKGNLEAQGILCSVRARFAFTESEIEQFKTEYENKLWQLVEAGNSYAELSVGKYLTQFLSQESFDYLNRAAEQGLSDAWYELGIRYLFQNGRMDRQNLLSKENGENYKQKSAECFYKGAIANKGIMATWCQITVGESFEDGHFYEKDYLKARFWYEKALENGDKRAISKIEILDALYR